MDQAEATPVRIRKISEHLVTDGVELVRTLHSDLFGRARGKQFPAGWLPSAPIGYSKVSLVEDLRGVPIEGEGFPAAAGHPDLHAELDLDRVYRPPWQPRTAWVLSRLVEHGRPSGLCSRSVLDRVCLRLDAVGLESVIATEPEFYLLHRDAENSPYSDGKGTSYTVGLRVDPREILDRIHSGLIGLGIDVTAANREFSPGQFEINVGHAPALEAADRAFLLKEAVKQMAVVEGLRAVFMPKPFTGAEGNSQHLHVSLLRDGESAFSNPDGSLSAECLSFIAGVLQHAPALTAIAAPTVNSYKRITAASLAPNEASWAHDNRFACLRIPAERGAATRVELRLGDAAANPYLLIAATLLAGADGIERKLQPPSAPTKLPTSLAQSIDALQADPVLLEGLGSELVDAYAALKLAEHQRFCRSVTDWEWSEYVDQA